VEKNWSTQQKKAKRKEEFDKKNQQQTQSAYEAEFSDDNTGNW